MPRFSFDVIVTTRPTNVNRVFVFVSFSHPILVTPHTPDFLVQIVRTESARKSRKPRRTTQSVDRATNEDGAAAAAAAAFTSDTGSLPFVYVNSQKGSIQLKTANGHLFVRERTVNDKVYWRCVAYTTPLRCKSRMHTQQRQIVHRTEHNHPPIRPPAQAARRLRHARTTSDDANE